jgi:hypothetical protein
MLEKTNRGFVVFSREIEDRDTKDCVRVQESSIALEGAHVRVLPGAGTEALHLNTDNAEKLANALLEFVRMARAGELTESS